MTSRRVGYLGLALVASACSFQHGLAHDDATTNDALHVDAKMLDAPAPQPCLADQTYADHGGHRYKAYAAGLDYDSAIDACTKDGAHLAVIDDASEDAYVNSLASDTWIGYDDLTTEGTFKWVTGATSTYTDWHSGEPNNNNNEDCAYAMGDGSWTDTSCGDTSHQTVCECQADYRPPPTPACRTKSGFTAYKGRHYFLVNALQSWNQAEATCEATGSYLTVISDVDENTAITGLYAADGWIGLSDQVTELTFVWVDGAPYGYTSWASGSPMTGTLGDPNDCVSANRSNGKWQDTMCALTKPSVCECDPTFSP